MGYRSFLFLIILLNYFSIIPVSADGESNLLPPNTDGQTAVAINLFISDILSIDEKEETFEVDGFLSAEWVDPRLAFDQEEFGYPWKTYRNEMVTGKLEEDIWWPDLYLVYAKGNRRIINSFIEVYPDGLVHYEERFEATIKQPFFLKGFPFDSHILELTISTFSYTDYEVVFTSEYELEPFEWETNEWIITDTGTLTVETISGYPYASYTLGISRLPWFYVSKFVLPLILIITISWAVFWMDYESVNIADRVEISLTSVLTVVAFDFVSSEFLPKLSYFTTLDLIMIVSYVILSLTILETLLSYIFTKRGTKIKARRLDFISRIAFPVIYYIIVLLVIISRILI
jgi:hypothetical protein